MAFQKAVRKAVPLKLSLQGVSFSGKTMSGIKLAHGLAGDKPVCVIDTENESAAMYDHLDFMHATIRPPFKPDKYIALIREAVDLGAGCVVIDSLSHAWQYILDYKDQLDQAGGRGAQWNNWAKAKPLWQTLKDAILQSPVHVVVTFRERADYAIESSDDGRNKKAEVKKLGTKAVAEEGSEYEFTTAWKLDKDTHLARVEKDRTGLFDGRTFLVDEGIGRELLQWLGAGDLEAGDGWKLLRAGDPDDFRSASEESDTFRRDQVRAIATKRRIPTAVTTALKDVAARAGQDWLQLILDADRYGATDAERVVRYVCGQCGSDPVPICRMLTEPNREPTNGKAASAKVSGSPESKPQTEPQPPLSGSPAAGIGLELTSEERKKFASHCHILEFPNDQEMFQRAAEEGCTNLGSAMEFVSGEAQARKSKKGPKA